MGNTREINQKHRDAMHRAQQAEVFSMQGDEERAASLFGEAYAMERDAALLLLDMPYKGFARSILFRSTASLAFRAGKYRESMEMVAAVVDDCKDSRTRSELAEIKRKAEQKITEEE